MKPQGVIAFVDREDNVVGSTDKDTTSESNAHTEWISEPRYGCLVSSTQDC